MLSDLSTRAHEGMRVNHGSLVHIRTDVHICRRHHDHGRSQICSGTHTAASGNDTHSALLVEHPGRDGILVKEGELALGHIDQLAQAESRKDDLLDP